MTIIRNTTAAFAVLAALGVASPAAAEVTPSHVYQVVDDIHRELLAILDGAGKQAKRDEEAPAVAERQPRHVIQEARELIHKIEEIHGHHGLPEIEEPPFPLHEITPEEVKEYVDLALEEIRALRPVFGVTTAPEPAPLPSGKTPTDVYELLHLTSLQLDGLGETDIKPFHVYRVALTVIHELDDIWDHSGLTGEVHLETHRGIGLQESYVEALALMADLQQLTQQDRFAIPGGVVPLNARSGDATPGDVMDVMNAVLADLGAVKVAVDSTEPVVFAPPSHSDVVPTNLYDAIFLARKMVEALAAQS